MIIAQSLRSNTPAVGAGAGTVSVPVYRHSHVAVGSEHSEQEAAQQQLVRDAVAAPAVRVHCIPCVQSYLSP